MPNMTQAGYTPPKAEIKKTPPQERKPKKKKKKSAKRMSGAAAFSLAVFFAAVLIGAATIYIYLQTQPFAHAYLPGTSLDHYPLGGVSREEAQAMLERTTGEAAAAWRLEMTYMGHSYTLTAEDVNLRVDAQATLDPLWQLGREGTMLSRYVRMLDVMRNPVDAKPVILYDMEAADALLDRVAADIERESADASMTFVPGTSEPFRFTDEVTGLKLHTQPLRAQIEQAIASLTPLDMVLVPQTIAPEVTRTMLESAIVLRGRQIVQIAADDASYTNVSLAAGRLHGQQIAPGGMLSFNETVGMRTAEAGYLEAPEPAYGVNVSGVGGGVCQASAALYRAALLAGLDVPVRSAAARPVSYCEAGQEAAVSDQGLDLVIANTTAYPLFIMARTYRDEAAAYLELQLIGEPLDVRYALESSVEETALIEEPVYVRDREGQYARYDDERVPVGKALPGYRAQTIRVSMDEGGEETARETVSEDIYEAIPPTVYVGIQVREQ